jgi:hypothetical protein
MKKLIAALLLAAGIVTVPVAAAEARAPKVDCTVFIYQPQTFWTQGAWRPKTVPHNWSVEDWFDYCSGRFRPQKKGPNRPMGPWGATIHLHMDCTYTADESWLRDGYGWKQAHLYISPWRG